MPTFGDRLREEREAMGISQQELADRCGVTMRSQRNYEKGERNPDSAYLAAIAAAGADVLYILTGQRQGGVPMLMSQSQGEVLAPDEKIMLNNYRRAPDGVKAGVKTTLETFGPNAGAKRGRAA